MNQDQLNSIRRMAGLAPSYDGAERKRLNETAAEAGSKETIIEEAANHRAPATVLAEIARRHLKVKTLKAQNSDDKDFHECAVWEIENALKAAFKAGQESAKSKVVKEGKDEESKEESKKGGSNPSFEPKGGEKLPKDGEDEVEKGDEDDDDKLDEKLHTRTSRMLKAMGNDPEEYEKDRVNKKAAKKLKKDAKATAVKEQVDPRIKAAQQKKAETQKSHRSNMNSLMKTREKRRQAKVDEGSSENYNNPKGTKLTADKTSGADCTKGNVYKDKGHKSDNSHSAKSEDKGAKGLKKIGEADDATVWGKDYGHDDDRIDRDESPDQIATMDPHDKEKVKVPAKYKTMLKQEIAELRDEAERVKARDPWGAEFYLNTATMFESLLERFEKGTRRSLAFAQIDLNRMMGPMTQRLPNEIYMFIVRGGKPASLTDLFHEVKVKDAKGADLSKEDYTS